VAMKGDGGCGASGGVANLALKLSVEGTVMPNNPEGGYWLMRCQRGRGGQGAAGACQGLERGIGPQGHYVSRWQWGGEAGGCFTHAVSNQGQQTKHCAWPGKGMVLGK